MKISECKVNHIVHPMGYDLKIQTFSWKYLPDTNEKKRIEFSARRKDDGLWEGFFDGQDDEKDCSVKVSVDGRVSAFIDHFSDFRVKECQVQIALDENFHRMIHDSGRRTDISCTAYMPDLTLIPCTRYFWRVRAWDKTGREYVSPVSWFETGKMDEPWQASWIRVPETHENMADPVIRRKFFIDKKVVQARIYMCGLGLYECYVNDHRINDGYLQPGYHSYHLWQQYETADLTGVLVSGENEITFLMGRGWYKGRFGIGGGHKNIYGSDWQLICEIHLTLDDGSTQIIGSDDLFQWASGPVLSDGIYDGEVYDATVQLKNWQPVLKGRSPKQGRLCERLSVPVVCKEVLDPKEILTDPDGNPIIDMGQNMTGWLVFKNRLPYGQKAEIRFGELLKDGRLCTDNLTDARQEFIYTSDGKENWIRPHFTYYGFRYAKLSGFPSDISIEDFQGWNLYSDLETTGHLVTGNLKVNQFIKNAMWSQRDNFLDHPSDCPQRAERLGWTGDAQMYCATACYNMDSVAFYRKYIRDMNEEQKRHKGMVPFIIPRSPAPGDNGTIDSDEEMTSAAWSDAAVMIPWTLYLYYGDKKLLSEQYLGMKAWVDYVRAIDDANGSRRLWQTGFHFGDWLALDNPEPGPFGRTDKYYIASCYYYNSTKLLAQAAQVLSGNTNGSFAQDAKDYGKLAEEIRRAILKEYFTPEGICNISTQTGYILAIMMILTDPAAIEKNGSLLAEKIRQNDGHLDTGFVGTPYICRALTRSGQNESAYTLLLKEDYPSWLYQVNMGATTVWESWDALDTKGHLTKDASLNHYAFGTLLEWLYGDVCGIHPQWLGKDAVKDTAGFRSLEITPHPDPRLKSACACVNTQGGEISAGWTYAADNRIDYFIEY